MNKGRLLRASDAHRFILLLILIPGLCSLAPVRSWSQAFVNGAIVGNVTDVTGAVIPGASMTLTNLGTNARLTAQTDGTGFYQFLNLAPGRYRLDAEKSGFKRFTREPLVVEVNSSVRIDLTLQVGAASQTVTVTAETPLLQPQTSSLGEVVETREVNELPLNGRNPMALIALAPGVVPQGGAGQNMVTLNPFASGNFQINGGEANQSAAYWDGAPLNSIAYLNMLALIPTQDSLQEFKVMTDNLPAEYDRFAGGIVSFTTKTGTNRVHGEAYEYLRNKVLNANSFFNNESGLNVAPFTQNQFGGNFGAPLVIPHLYNGKDKTFFFASFDGFRLREGLPLLFTVPTLAERGGDFSGYLNGNGTQIPIYDPASTVLNPSTQQYVRTQASCNGALNVICPANLDPTAQVLANLWGPPNTAGAQYTNVNNWAGNASEGGDVNQFTIRVDQNVSDKQRFFARYTINKLNNLGIDPFHTETYPLSIGVPENYKTQQAAVDESYSFTPRTMLDVEFSMLREGYTRTPASLGYNLSKLGPGWAPITNEVPFTTLPSIGVSGITDFSSELTGSVIEDYNNDWIFTPNLTMIRGRHTLKFGLDFWVSQENWGAGEGGGNFSFNSAFTAAGPFNPVGGSGFASFMYGAVSSGSQENVNFTAATNIYRAFYAQDNFQVNRKLTLNLGFRYNQEGPPTERFNRITTFLPNLASPLAQPAGLPDLTGALALVDTPQRPGRSGYNMGLTHFAPRFGFGYQITPTTVLRGGYGIFWLPNLQAGSDSPAGDAINSFYTPVVGTINGGITPYNRLSNPWPTGISPPPGRAADFQYLNEGGSLSTIVPNNPFYGYVQQWNLDLQKQLPGAVFVDVAYAASRGIHLPLYGQLNQLPLQDMSMGNNLFNSVPNPFYGLVPSFSSLATSTVTAGQLLLPYPQYTGVSPMADEFDSRYNSMQMKVRKNFKNGQTLLVSYTISKLITDTDTMTGWLEANGSTQWAIQNFYNLKGEESLASFDVPQRLVASYVLDLPVGKGKKFLNHSTGAPGKLVSGWGVEGTTTFQRGFPLFLTTASNLTGSYNGGSRPNFDANACPQGAPLRGSAESRLNMWFNTACYVQPPAFTFGNVSRTLPNVRTDGLSNFDFAIFKNTTFGPEARLGLQFRAEFFNLFNTPQFGYPGTTAGTPEFGVVSSQLNNPRLVQFGLKFLF